MGAMPQLGREKFKLNSGQTHFLASSALVLRFPSFSCTRTVQHTNTMQINHKAGGKKSTDISICTAFQAAHDGSSTKGNRPPCRVPSTAF